MDKHEDRQTNKDRQKKRLTDKNTVNKHEDRQTNSWTGQIDQSGREGYTDTDIQTDRQTDRQTDSNTWKADRQTKRWTDLNSIDKEAVDDTHSYGAVHDGEE